MKSIRPSELTGSLHLSSVASSTDVRASGDAALARAITAHHGDVVAAAAAVGVSPARAWKRVQVDDAFVGVRASVDSWVAQHTASATLPRASSPAAAEHRRQAALCEAGAIAASTTEAKVAGLHRAVHHWLGAASTEPSPSVGAPRAATTNALRCLDVLTTLTADDPASPWPAVRAALMGDIDGCARLVPLSLMSPAARDAVATVRDVNAATTLNRLVLKISHLSSSTPAREVDALVASVVEAIEKHPQAATRCAAVAVEAFARAGRLDAGAAGVGRALRTLGTVIHRAATIEGVSGASSALLVEADAYRLAGRFRRARSLVAAARDATHDPAQRRDIALAQLRLEHAAGRPEQQLDAVARARADIDVDATDTTRGAEQALLAVLAAQAWVDVAAAHRAPARWTQVASPIGRSLQALARGALSALGLTRPAQNSAQPAPSSRTTPLTREAALDAARTELVRARAALAPGSNVVVAAAIEQCHRQLRAAHGTNVTSAALAIDTDHIVRVLEAMPLARAAGLPVDRLFDVDVPVGDQRVGGRTGALMGLAGAPRSGLVPSGGGASVGDGLDDGVGRGIDAALAAALQRRAVDANVDANANANVVDTTLGFRLAMRLTPAPRAPAPRLSDDVDGRLRLAFQDIADVLGIATPTAGPETQDEVVRRLKTLGFAPRSITSDAPDSSNADGGAVVAAYGGHDPRFAEAVVRVTPRRFAGVGDDAYACEVALGTQLVDDEGELRFVASASQVHIGALVFSSERWEGVQRGYDDTLARAAAALRTVGGRRMRPGSLAEVRTLISLGRGEAVDGGSRLDRVRDLRELHQLQRKITERAAALKSSGVIEGFHLEIGEENAAGKTTIGQMALDAVGEAGFRTRSYSPKAPTAQERAQHPIQRHIDNGPSPGEAVFSDRTMAGSYAYNVAADDAWLHDMATRRRAWDDGLREAGIAQVSLQVNPGRAGDGLAIDDYAAQTTVVMGKREARAAVARHLLATLDDDALTADERDGLQAAAAAGPGYRDLESLHTGEQAALRAEHFARTVSNPANEWGFVGSFERHPSRVQILQAVVDKLDAFAEQARARAQDTATLFSDGVAMPMPQDPGVRAAWLGLVGPIASRGAASDVINDQCDGVAARRVADDRVEVVVRLKKKPGDPGRLPRADIVAHARALLGASGVVDVDVRIFDPALCTVV